jgi:hypothetical protein
MRLGLLILVAEADAGLRQLRSMGNPKENKPETVLIGVPSQATDERSE